MVSLKPVFLPFAILVYVGSSLWITNWTARETKTWGDDIRNVATIGQKTGHTFLGLLHVYLWRFEKASWMFYGLAYPLLVISTFFIYLSYDLLNQPEGFFFSEFLPSSDPFLQNAFMAMGSYMVATLGHIMHVTILFRMLNGYSCRTPLVFVTSIYAFGSAALTFVYSTADKNVESSTKLWWPGTIIAGLLAILAFNTPRAFTFDGNGKKGAGCKNGAMLSFLNVFLAVASSAIFISKALVLIGWDIKMVKENDPALGFKIVNGSYPLACFFVWACCIFVIPVMTLLVCRWTCKRAFSVTARIWDLSTVVAAVVCCSQGYFIIMPFLNEMPEEFKFKFSTINNFLTFLLINLTPVYMVVLNLYLQLPYKIYSDNPNYSSRKKKQ